MLTKYTASEITSRIVNLNLLRELQLTLEGIRDGNP